MQYSLALSFGKTCPESSPHETTHSDTSSLRSAAGMSPSVHLTGPVGHVKVWLPDRNGRWHGEPLTRGISDCPLQGGASTSLDSILVKGPIPAKYYLKPEQLKAIARKAAANGIMLHPLLAQALAA
jgi:hypothetical protein